MACCKGNKHIRNLRMLVPLVTIVVSIFDLATDWWAFQTFVVYDGQGLMIALAVVCSIASIFFFAEIYDGFKMLTIRCKRRSRIQSAMKASKTTTVQVDNPEEIVRKTAEERQEENKVERLHEALTFVLLIVEDIPSVVILYFAFRQANCDLYLELFEESVVAYVSLFGAGLSALWKTLLSLVFCIQCCRCYDFERCEAKAFCCACRVLRPLLACIFILFVSFFLANLYFDQRFKIDLGDGTWLGLEERHDCLNSSLSSTTAAPGGA